MLRLTTIGPVAIHIGDARVPTANHQVWSALLYLIVERGQPVPRRTLIDLFFPDASDDAGAHSLRQLIYRLRKLGAIIDSDPAMVRIPEDSASWDVDLLLTKAWASEAELAALQRGYLADYEPRHSDRFAEWLDQHRAHVSSRLRHLLIAQLKAERSQRRFRALENVARACLALDPLNEEATLAAAESLAMAGAKSEAVALLDDYLGEIGHRAKELKIPPRILRERISDYVADADISEKIPLIGRDSELKLISSIVERSADGSPRACVVSGPSGIGKTRLLNEACSLAALSGFAIARGKLYPHDARRPFAILRDIGPALLDLPGALGASPESLATVRGLCGRGPSQFRSVPTELFETQAVVAELHARVLELIDAIALEQPVVIYIEDAHWIDDASLDLLGDLMDDQRAVCVLIATQRSLQMPPRMADSLGMNDIRLAALTSGQSQTVLESLFAQTRLPTDEGFIESATRVSGGVPFYLHVLFRHYQQTGDASAIPPGLSASLAARLDVLAEPTRSVFDAIVILGSSGSENRLEKLTQLPRYALLEALRTLESAGMIRVTQNSLTASHDLFAAAASTRMSPAVARLLHRGAAVVLESEATGEVEPLELASHWEACGEDPLALKVLTRSADRSLRLGRPQEAIELLLSAQRVARSSDDERGVEVALFKACRASHLFLQADGYASKLVLHSGALGGELQAGAIDNVYALGRSLVPFKSALEELARDKKGSIPQRTKAATLLTILGEELGDAELARWGVIAIEDIGPVSYEVLTPRLIFETAFGSRSKTVEVATQLCETVLASGTRVAQLHALPNAAYALYRSGCVDRALEYATMAYSIAKAEKLGVACQYVSSLVATMKWNTGDTEGTRQWLRICCDHISRTRCVDKAIMRFSLGIMLALEDNDPDSAEQLLKEAERAYPRVMENSHALDRFAYQMRIAVARGATIDRQVTDHFVSCHISRRGAGLQDEVADTAIMLLLRSGRSTAAELLRNEYLSRWRKDGFTPTPSLRNLHAPIG